MTPEEKLLALIQQDKRQGASSVTPQEKLLALLEQDKRKSGPAQVQPVVAAAPIPVATPLPPQPVAQPPLPVIAKPVPAPVKPATVVVPPPEVKKAPLVVLPPPAPVPAPVKPAPVVEATPSEAKKAPLVAVPPPPAAPAPVPVSVTPVVIPLATQQLNTPTTPLSPQPMAFPSIRLSGVTITNRVLALVAMILVVVVFYSVAGTQRGIREEMHRQMSGAGEMSVIPLSISDEPIPGVDVFVAKVETRNFFLPKKVEKNSEGGAEATPMGLTKDFKLVAVSVDAATPSESMAIIKGKADSKTYFVKLGESVGDTGFVLSKVLADRVVLKQRKQEFELK